MGAGGVGIWLPLGVGLSLLAGAIVVAASLQATWRDLRRVLGLAAARRAPALDAACGLDDIALDWLAVALPALPVWLGDAAPPAGRLLALWLLPLGIGTAFGIAFQRVTHRPGRDLSAADALRAALTDDAGTLIAWLLALSGGVAMLQEGLDPGSSPLAGLLPPLALLAGCVAAYPLNWRLVRAGLPRPGRKPGTRPRRRLFPDRDRLTGRVP